MTIYYNSRMVRYKITRFSVCYARFKRLDGELTIKKKDYCADFSPYRTDP